MWSRCSLRFQIAARRRANKLTLYIKLFDISITYDHRTLKTRLPVRSALFKQRTGGLVVRWVTTSEYPLLYVFAHDFPFAYVNLIRQWYRSGTYISSTFSRRSVHHIGGRWRGRFHPSQAVRVTCFTLDRPRWAYSYPHGHTSGEFDRHRIIWRVSSNMGLQQWGHMEKRVQPGCQGDSESSRSGPQAAATRSGFHPRCSEYSRDRHRSPRSI